MNEPGNNAYKNFVLELSANLAKCENTTNIKNTTADLADLAFRDYLISVMLTSTTFTTIVNVHVWQDQALNFYKLSHPHATDSISKFKTIDHLKEFCNLLAGKIKAAFAEIQSPLHQSLPFVVSGYSHALFQKIVSYPGFTTWTLNPRESQLEMSCYWNVRSSDFANKFLRLRLKDNSPKTFLF